MKNNKKGLILNGIFVVFEIIAIILTVMYHNSFELYRRFKFICFNSSYYIF